MAALSPLLVFKDGDAHRVALYRVLGANTGDTIDVSGEFKKIVSGRIIEVSSALADFAPTVSVAGTVITITGASLVNDALYVLVYGGAS